MNPFLFVAEIDGVPVEPLPARWVIVFLAIGVAWGLWFARYHGR